MQIESLALPEVKRVTPRRFADERGHFVEVYNAQRFQDAGLSFSPVQENQSLSRVVGTVRGLHFQRAPFAQAKLVRVLRGRIYDVAVDVRPASPTFGRWLAEELSADNGHAVFIPSGFAHGFCTLEPDTEIAYLVDQPYSAEHDGTVLWNDPHIGITWPAVAGSVLSPKDTQAPTLFKAQVDGGPKA